MRTGLGGITWAIASVTVFANSKPPALPGTYEGNLMGTRVGIVGDSVTCLSSQYLTADFSPHYAFQIRCKNGITITEGTQFATGIDEGVAGAPSVLIVNLGTNDAVRAMHDVGPQDDADIAAAEQNLNVLAWDVQHVPCVIWVTVSEVPDALGSHVARAINQWMASRAAAVPGN
ncbi:MAG TPA: hypothetical protein VL961_06550, partial [Acidimicrobiales bacterium]|nr:hypothetical protein [Acidimicrobiales bacterium]